MMAKRIPLKSIFLSPNLDLKWMMISINNAIRITYCGWSTKVITNKSMVIKPVQTYQAGKPSRYKTKMNILYIKALPGSGWGSIRNTGKNTIAKACTCLFTSFKLICVSLKYLANANAVAAFANSEGCSVKLPKPYQHRCPAIVFPNINKNLVDLLL